MHTFIYEYMMDLVAPLVAPALSQKPAFVTYFVARGAPRPCYIPEGFDSLPYVFRPKRAFSERAKLFHLGLIDLKMCRRSFEFS